MTISESINARLSALIAAPKTHACVTTYADGTTRRLEQPSRIQCENYAVGERRKIGRSLIDRTTGKIVCVVSVNIVAL